MTTPTNSSTKIVISGVLIPVPTTKLPVEELIKWAKVYYAAPANMPCLLKTIPDLRPLALDEEIDLTAQKEFIACPQLAL